MGKCEWITDRGYPLLRPKLSTAGSTEVIHNRGAASVENHGIARAIYAQPGGLRADPATARILPPTLPRPSGPRPRLWSYCS